MKLSAGPSAGSYVYVPCDTDDFVRAPVNHADATAVGKNAAVKDAAVKDAVQDAEGVNCGLESLTVNDASP